MSKYTLEFNGLPFILVHKVEFGLSFGRQMRKTDSSPFAAGCAGISPVSAMNSQNVSLDIGVPSEQLETHATRELVIGKC